MSYIPQNQMVKPKQKSSNNLSSYINTYISSYIDNYINNDEVMEERKHHEKNRFNYFGTLDDYSPPPSPPLQPPQNIVKIKEMQSNNIKSKKIYINNNKYIT